ncbi:MAG: GGDEF domain-containing protein [Pseudomonadota bacterium]
MTGDDTNGWDRCGASWSCCMPEFSAGIPGVLLTQTYAGLSIFHMKLNRDFFSFISRFNLLETLGDSYDSFFKEITYVNFVRSRIMGSACAVIFVVVLGLDMAHYLSGKWQVSSGYALLFYSHCSILAFMCIPVLVNFLKPAESPGDVTLFHKRVIDTAMFFGLSNMVVISMADVLINGSIAAYLGSIFAFAAIFLMTTRFALILFAGNMALMVSLLVFVSNHHGISLRIQILNAITFALVAFVLSRLLFYYHVKDFSNRLVIRQQRERLEEMSMTDHLTKALNRRSFLDLAQTEIARTNRHANPVSMCLFDLDHFKAVNDRYGHYAGDIVLVDIAGSVQQNIRETDIFARWGGEEFLILCPQTDKDGMEQLCEKLRETIAALTFEGAPSVTASFGVTQFVPGESWNDFVQRCDKALYQAKGKGRNRVETLG